MFTPNIGKYLYQNVNVVRGYKSSQSPPRTNTFERSSSLKIKKWFDSIDNGQQDKSSETSTNGNNQFMSTTTTTTPKSPLELRRIYHAPLMTYYSTPLQISHGFKQYLYDTQGNKYLDMFGGVLTVSVGHSHPVWAERLKDQLTRVQHHSGLYANELIGHYSKHLIEKLNNVVVGGGAGGAGGDPVVHPSDSSIYENQSSLNGRFDKVFLVNSGTEATDLAVLLARVYTGNFDLIALRNGYHGMGYQAMGLVGLQTWRFNVPTGFGVHHVMAPIACGLAARTALTELAVQDMQSVIQHSTPGKLAAFIAESVQGVGGVNPYTDGYLKAVYDITRQHGGLCIADEVQTGFARLGSHFWGFERHGVRPDIVTIAKGIGNGFPMAAVATSTEIMDTIQQRLYFNTFGGNPLACVAGQAVLDIIDQENLQSNASYVGSYIKHQLTELQKLHGCIGDVRGYGLMLGVEIVEQDGTPAPTMALRLLELLKHRLILIGKGGLLGNVLRIGPPLCITMEDAEFFISEFHQVLNQFHR